jgi:uncharacterized membrane-anchored protein YhcB (DUF1043 family)
LFKQVSILLNAVDETIKEQSEELSPIAYFGTLMSIIEDATDLTVVVSCTYLLSIVFQHVPHSVLKLKFDDISTLFEKLLISYQDNAPIVRAVTKLLEVLLCAQDNLTWKKNTKCKKILQDILSLSLDSRPKVRKIAVDAVRKVIAYPPFPTNSHPGTPFVIDFCLLVFDNLDKKLTKDNDAHLMDCLVMLKVLVPIFSIQSKNEKVAKKLGELAECLLGLPVRSSAGNTVLTQWVFMVLNALLATEQEQKLEFKVVVSVVSALIQLSPYENDAVLTPSWLEIMVTSFSKLSEYVRDVENNLQVHDSLQEFAEKQYEGLLVSFFKRIFTTFFQKGNSIKVKIMDNATVLLSSLFELATSNTMVNDAKLGKGGLLEMISMVQESLSDIHQRENWGNLLLISCAVFNRLGKLTPSLTFPLLQKIMSYRDDKSFGSQFPFKVEIEQALFSAVQNMGIKEFCSVMPLNIESTGDSEVKRPYLLSIFATSFTKPSLGNDWDQLSCTGSQEFGYFVEVLLPLADRMLKKAGLLWSEDRQLESKVYETLGLQVWSLFPLISATLPKDVPESFGALAPYLGRVLTTLPSVLYENLPSETDLRPLVCQGLESLIEQFMLLEKIKPKESDDSIELQYKRQCEKTAKKSLNKIKAYVNRFLSALCNIYSTVDVTKLKDTKSSGANIQVMHEKSIQFYEKPIRKFLLIAQKSAILEYCETLINSIDQKRPTMKDSEQDRLTVFTMIDLVLILLPNLEAPKDQSGPVYGLYKICLGELKNPNNTMQKKVYKALFHIFDLINVSDVDLSELVEGLCDEEVISNTSHGAAKSRVKLIEKLVTTTNDKEILLKFVPRVLPEVMLTTKEASEKSREVAYECLISMAKKMMSGQDAISLELSNSVQQMKIDELKLQNGEHVGEISIREFMLMVLAGLGGSSAHMQSASVACLGRLLFEFSEALDAEMVGELVKTVLLCITFKNREVTKACLGFIKVAVVCLDQELLRSHLEAMITTILAHSQDHKSHFKSKVRHIFERMIRKFSYEEVDMYFPDSDKKLILNIKKRKESLKKRKQASRNQDQEEGEKKVEKKSKFDDAFDSGSELESDADMDEDYIPEQFKEEKGNSKNVFLN